MAVPRIFVSSTYYDLRHVRDDIEIFLKGLGYTPVMHDKGNITAFFCVWAVSKFGHFF